MATFQCNNFGSCSMVGSAYRTEAPVGSGPECTGCGMPMTLQVKTHDYRRFSGGRLLGIGAMVVGVMCIGWLVYRFAIAPRYEYSLIGSWRSESTETPPANLPIGLNIEFTERALRVLGTDFPIAEYDRRGAVIKVFLASGVWQITPLTFVFEERDRMYFHGPFGVKFRYKRLKTADGSSPPGQTIPSALHLARSSGE